MLRSVDLYRTGSAFSARAAPFAPPPAGPALFAVAAISPPSSQRGKSATCSTRPSTRARRTRPRLASPAAPSRRCPWAVHGRRRPAPAQTSCASRDRGAEARSRIRIATGYIATQKRRARFVVKRAPQEAQW